MAMRSIVHAGLTTVIPIPFRKWESPLTFYARLGVIIELGDIGD